MGVLIPNIDGEVMIGQFNSGEISLLLLVLMIVLWALGRYALRVDANRWLVRITRMHWKISIVSAFLLGVLLIIAGFNISDRITTAIIAVLPASIYYLYSEHLDQPTVSIDTESTEWSVAPMRLPEAQLQEIDGVELPVGAEFSDIDEAEEDDVTAQTTIELESAKSIEINASGAEAVRPAVFLKYDVVNEGKATAERATVQLRIHENGDSVHGVARWTDPANSDEYDLRPGQRESIHVFKSFLTPTFIPSNPMASSAEKVKKSDLDLSSVRLKFNFVGNPEGSIDIYAQYENEEFQPLTYIPRKKRPERSQRSIGGGWEGTELSTPESRSVEYTLETRLIADNYRTEWQSITDIKIPAEFVQIAIDESHWQEQWEGNLEWIKERTIEYAEAYLNESQGFSQRTK